MAGDWIKMRTDLYRDPKVSVVADLLMDRDGDLARFVSQNCQRDMTVTRNVTRNVTVGALVSVWGVLRHRGKRVGDDLVVRCATLYVIDDVADLPGFGAAMASVGWVEETPEGLVFPRFFEEYNVEPAAEAKQKNAERQRRHREKRAEKSNALRNVTVTSQSNAREEKSREEKSREEKGREEEKQIHPAAPPRVRVGSGFDEWYAAYPRKEAKEAARKAYPRAVAKIAEHRGIPPPEAEAWLLDVTRLFAASPKGRGEFVPHPTTFLNQGRYDDDPNQWTRTDRSGPGQKQIAFGPGQIYSAEHANDPQLGRL